MGSVCKSSGSVTDTRGHQSHVGSLHLDFHFHGAVFTKRRKVQPPPLGRPALHTHRPQGGQRGQTLATSPLCHLVLGPSCPLAAGPTPSLLRICSPAQLPSRPGRPRVLSSFCPALVLSTAGWPAHTSLAPPAASTKKPAPEMQQAPSTPTPTRPEDTDQGAMSAACHNPCPLALGTYCCITTPTPT